MFMATNSSKTNKKNPYIHAVGRRKTGVARVRLYLKTAKTTPKLASQMVVNDQPIEAYFTGEAAKRRYEEPLRTTDSLDKFVATIKVEGGGKTGQLEAVMHGLARAIDKADREAYHSLLKKKGLLTRDPRTRERRKVGMGGKARRRKQSPKR